MTNPMDDFLYRASLPYSVAFDYCAQQLATVDGLLGLLSAHSFYERELRSRMGRTLSGDARDFAMKYNGLLLAEPSHAQLAEWQPQLETALYAGGRLVVLTSNALARRLPEWQYTTLCDNPAGTQAVRQWLSGAGYTLLAQVGFFSLQAIALSRVYAQLGAMGREALSDRLLHAMYHVYTVTGWQTRLAPVTVLVAQKGPA